MKKNYISPSFSVICFDNEPFLAISRQRSNSLVGNSITGPGSGAGDIVQGDGGGKDDNGFVNSKSCWDTWGDEEEDFI